MPRKTQEPFAGLRGQRRHGGGPHSAKTLAEMAPEPLGYREIGGIIRPAILAQGWQAAIRARVE